MSTTEVNRKNIPVGNKMCTDILERQKRNKMYPRIIGCYINEGTYENKSHSFLDRKQNENITELLQIILYTEKGMHSEQKTNA